MFVTGQGTNTPGTVLPSLVQLSRELPIEALVVARNPDHRERIGAQVNELNGQLGGSMKVEYRPLADNLDATLGSWKGDCAIVSVPDHLHCEVGSQVLERDLHCLMVKPLAPSIAEGQRLLELQRKRGLHAAVEFHKRFDVSNLTARQLVADGKLGELLYSTVAYSQRAEVPLERFAAWVSDTNIFQYLAVHYVDILYFVTGYLPRSLTAMGTRGLLAAKGIDGFDSVLATIRWESPDDSGRSFVSQIATSWVDPAGTTSMSDQGFVLVGTAGRLECDQKNRGIELITDAGSEAINPYFSRILPNPSAPETNRFQGYGFESIHRFIQDVEDIEKGRCRPADLESCRPSFREAMVSTRVVDAVNRCLQAPPAWVELDRAQ